MKLSILNIVLLIKNLVFVVVTLVVMMMWKWNGDHDDVIMVMWSRWCDGNDDGDNDDVIMMMWSWWCDQDDGNDDGDDDGKDDGDSRRERHSPSISNSLL